MTIAAILAAKGTDVATIASDAPLSTAVDELGGRRIGALLVIDAGEVKGIMSERDVIYCLREARGTDPRLAGQPGDERAGYRRAARNRGAVRHGADDPAADSPLAGDRRRAS